MIVYVLEGFCSSSPEGQIIGVYEKKEKAERYKKILEKKDGHRRWDCYSVTRYKVK